MNKEQYEIVRKHFKQLEESLQYPNCENWEERRRCLESSRELLNRQMSNFKGV